MRLVVAQIDFLVGDIDGNCEQILVAAGRAVEEHQADLVVFPELALTGYPPEDLLLRPSLNTRVGEALEGISRETPVAVIVGYPAVRKGSRVNVAGYIAPRSKPVEYIKQCLPTGRLFEEQHYFECLKTPSVLDINGLKVGLLIGEDAWHDGPIEQAVAAGAELLISLNASPYRQGKHERRLNVLEARLGTKGVPLVYCNLVGGQDTLVFDGGSMLLSGEGKRLAQAPFFESCLWPVEVSQAPEGAVQLSAKSTEPADLSVEESTWLALVLALRDYVRKNGFDSAVLGLSGGIDSALVLALAVEALGADKVQAVMMPYHYTSSMSTEDAEKLAANVGVTYHVLPIAEAINGFDTLLLPLFEGTERDKTEENLQARCRGVLLMALSNKLGALVMSTGNKSEAAVGYATLYGDMVGGFGVIADVSKTWVYRLARYCNEKAGKEVIPERIITRPPSAELSPGQLDQDSLPDYDVLDAILECYVERDMSAEATIRAGYDRDTVYRVVKLVDQNEYKRHQAALGPCITARSFSRDRRYPITNGWRPGD